MKMLFEYNGHKIVVTRGIAYAELEIDSTVSDVINGFTNTQMKSFKLNGKAKNPDGSVDSVRVEVEFGIPYDTVTAYYAGKSIGTQKTAF